MPRVAVDYIGRDNFDSRFGLFATIPPLLCPRGVRALEAVDSRSTPSSSTVPYNKKVA